MPFNIGPGELLVILIIALLLFGPKKLPELGKALGESIGSFKRSLIGQTPPEPGTLPAPPAATLPAASQTPTEAAAPADASASSEEK